MPRGVRSLIAGFATVALVFSGSLVFTSAAHAAGGDPVVFVDQNLADAVNAKLGQNPGDTITEDQAAGITSLTAENANITDLGGIEYLTGLTSLYLDDNNIVNVSPLSGLTSLTDLRLARNSIVNVSPLSGLTNLTTLGLRGNDIVNVSPLSGLTNLTSLYLGDNNIVNVSPLSGLTNLTDLRLARNNIVNVSPLSGLTNLTYLPLSNQSASVPSAAVSHSTANPVINVDGTSVPVDSSDAGFVYDAATNEWSFDSTGTKVLTWSILIAVGDASEVTFSGAISQEITELPPLIAVTPQTPGVVEAVCVDGEVVGPTINLPTTEGIDYTIEGDVTPGATVTVTATPTDGHYVTVEPDTGWVGDSDGLYATLEITLDTVECDTPPVIDGDEDTPPVGDDGIDTPPVTVDDGKDAPKTSTEELARTGPSQSVTIFAVLGALLTLAGAALVAIRRRTATR